MTYEVQEYSDNPDPDGWDVVDAPAPTLAAKAMAQQMRGEGALGYDDSEVEFLVKGAELGQTYIYRVCVQMWTHYSVIKASAKEAA